MVSTEATQTHLAGTEASLRQGIAFDAHKQDYVGTRWVKPQKRTAQWKLSPVATLAVANQARLAQKNHLKK